MEIMPKILIRKPAVGFIEEKDADKAINLQKIRRP